MCVECMTFWHEYMPQLWNDAHPTVCPAQCETGSESAYRRPNYSYFPNGTLHTTYVSTTRTVQGKNIYEGCWHQPKCSEYVWGTHPGSVINEPESYVLLSGYAGSVVGSLVLGVFIDRYFHPKDCLIFVISTMVFGATTLIFSPEWDHVWFFIMGIGVGGSYTVSVTTAIKMTKLRVEGYTIPQEIALIFMLLAVGKLLMRYIIATCQDIVLPTMVANPDPTLAFNPNP